MSRASVAAEGTGPAAARPGGGLVTGLDVAVALAFAIPLSLWRTRCLFVPTLDGSWRGLADPPSLLHVAVAALTGIGLAAVLARHPAPVRRALVALVCAAAPLVVMAGGRGIALLAFQGPALVVLGAACLAVAIVRARPLATIPTLSGLVAFGLAFGFYALVGLRVPGPAGLQGDEPHYLVMAQSLLSDGDLDLTDEFARREYATFFAGTLKPHTSPASPAGVLYPVHTPGLAALLLPAYALGGAAGARLLLSALAALAGVLLHRIVREVLDEPTASAAWAVFTFTPPLPFYAVALYPETPAVLAVAVLLWTSGRDPKPTGAMVATLAAAALPWLHPKFIPLALAGLALTCVRRCSWRLRAAAMLGFASSVGLLFWFFAIHYGQASLGAAYGPGLSADVSLRRSPWGLLALFLDRQFGLLAVSPVWLLSLPGAIVLLRRRTGDALRGGVLASSVLLVGASFSMWWGGACPPARFVLPALPVLALAAAPILRSRLAPAAGLAGASLAVVALVADAPRALHNRNDGESALLRFLAPALDLDGWLPSFVPGPTASGVVLALSLLAALALTWRFGRRGLLAGVVAYALVATAFLEGPLLDRRLATAGLLEAWDPARIWGPVGPPDLARTSMPLGLPGAPWLIRSGDVRNSRRLDLPPGHYRLDVRSRVLEALPTAHVVRLDVAAGELILESGYVRAGAPPLSLDLPLPAGVRRLVLTAAGAQGLALIEGATVVPLSVVPRPLRVDLAWPRIAEPDRYRVESRGVRVTALDRSAPGGEGFTVEGNEGSFLLEATSGGAVELRVRRPHPDPRDAVVWVGRRIPLGSRPDAVLSAPAESPIVLGTTAVIPVRIESREAWVAFAAGP